MSTDGAQELAKIILEEKEKVKSDERYAKMRTIMLLLARGSMLAFVLAAPGTARLLKNFSSDNSDWKEWKMFNRTYLRRTIKKLEAKKLVEIENNGTRAVVKLTENGQKKVLKFGLESLVISKPERWDGRWTLVFYDVVHGKKTVRERLRHYLHCAGFYQLQESVYLHAYPCEKEVDFLRHFLGVAGEVRIIFADKIENDQIFRDYFGV